MCVIFLVSIMVSVVLIVAVGWIEVYLKDATLDIIGLAVVVCKVNTRSTSNVSVTPVHRFVN